jgi:putative transposase
MARNHKPEEIIGKLREAEIVLAQGGTVADACRRIGVTEQSYYLYGRLSLCKSALKRSAWISLQTSIRRQLARQSAQMGNPHTRTSTAGRPCRPR